MKRQVMIFGAGDLAQLAHFYFKYDSDYQVAAFTVDETYRLHDNFCGLPLVAFEEVENLYAPSDFEFFVAVSYAKLNTVRAQKCAAVKIKGYRLVSYISSKATTWPGMAVGENCFILEDNTIQPFVKIGNNVTLWSGNHIGHHAEIGDNCFITSHVVISGGARVHENCFIGVNATIRDHVTIGKNCVIGAGAVILKDTGEGEIYTAEPAKLSRIPANRDRLKRK